MDEIEEVAEIWQGFGWMSPDSCKSTASQEYYTNS
jgi:hypothetical protein